MDHYFTMYFNGYEIMMPKKDVEFRHGYGIVRPFLDITINGIRYYEPLIGVVNQDFKPVLSLVLKAQVDKLDIVQDGVLFKVMDSLDDTFHIYILKEEDSHLVEYKLTAQDYTYINDSIIKLQLVTDDTWVEVLYNVVTREVISPAFNAIDDFHFSAGKNAFVAFAAYFLPYDEHHFNKLVTQIDLKGNVITPYYDVDQNKFYEQNQDIGDIIDCVVQDMKEHRR